MTFDTLKLDKGLYTSNKGFTAALEEIDPSEAYKGTELEGLDAYERQLKRFDIKVSGKNSDTISKFFATSDSAVLFPEYLSRAVRSGLDTSGILDDIVATTTVIDSLDYRSIESVNPEIVNDTDNVINEGAFIPETVVKTKDKLTTLHKCGRSLVASYEAIKTQKLDLFTITLKQIGSYIANCQLIYAMQELMSSDRAALSSAEAGKLSYADFVDMWEAVSPYQMNTVLAESGAMKKILQIDEFKDSNAGLAFHGTGNMVTPMGAKLVHAHTSFMGDNIIALDKAYALEKVQLGDIVTDFDKLIDRQLERATVTCTTGFNRILDGASCVMAM